MLMGMFVFNLLFHCCPKYTLDYDHFNKYCNCQKQIQINKEHMRTALHLNSYSHSPQRSNPSKNQQLSTTCFDHTRHNPILKGSGTGRKSTYLGKLIGCQEHYNKNLTFKPVIHEMPADLFPKTRGKVSRSREQIREKLIEDTTKIIRYRNKKKAQKEEQQAKGCTFHPVVSEFALTVDRKAQIFQKLFDEAQQIRQHKAQAYRQKLQKQSIQIQQLLAHKLYPSKPCVLNNQKHNLSPIHTRIAEIVQSKLKLHKKLQQQYDKQKSITFQPQIGTNSEHLAKKKIEREKLKTDVVERLMEQYEKMKERRQKQVQFWKSREEQQCTFNPEINSYVGNGEHKGYEDLWQNRERSAVSAEEYIYPFKPKIDRLSNLIVQHTRGQEDHQTKMNRLSREPLEQKNANIQKLKQQIYSQFTFKPNTTQFFTEVIPEAKRHICEHPPQQVFSFMPKINQNSRLIRPQSAQASKLRIKKRQMQYQLQSQYEQMKECSFRPKINNHRHQGQRILQNVSGVDRFLEIRQKVKKNAEDLKQRQKRIFSLELKYDKRKNYQIGN